MNDTKDVIVAYLTKHNIKFDPSKTKEDLLALIN
nr:MAG TPA: Putative stress-responsive nuclear envelope protein [Caudoviricetes sp.]